MGRPPAKDARDTRQEIVDAALNLFAEKGFFGTSMREIARAVGVRESAIYHHFTNKEELLNTLMREAGEARAQRFDEALEKHKDLPVRELLTHIAQGMLESWVEVRNQKLYRLLSTEGVRLAETGKIEVDVSFRKARQRLDKLFADLAAAGQIRPTVPGLAPLEFMAPLFLIRNMKTSPHSYHHIEGVTPEQLIEAHIDFLCRALVP
jgi:AcrR family transcriptional regulator